jgi:hypothetical protein
MPLRICFGRVLWAYQSDNAFLAQDNAAIGDGASISIQIENY